MAEVFAGLIAGFGLSLVAAPLLAWRLLLLRGQSEIVARILPAGTPVVAVALMVHFASVLALTALGIILGMLLLALEDESGALGSANGPYTLLVFGLVLAISAPIFAIFSATRQVVLAFALLALAVFGWLMPYLAEWSKFD